MEPKLRIVVPSVELITPVEWIKEMPRLIETCGRICHKSEARAGADTATIFIHKVANQMQHLSILEHCSITVKFICSRAASHQLVRHRIAAYSQSSQRYCDYSKDRYDLTLDVIVPPSLYNNDYVAWKAADGSVVARHDLVNTRSNKPLQCYLVNLLDAYETYLYLRDGSDQAKIPAEDARFVLPNACSTEIATTYNIRQWRHVFQMRLSKHAQWEIRHVMREALDRFNTLAPVLFEGSCQQ
jgi:thymidylate synthase (FAD)